ncbi:sulfatase-like hydrolase/transferase, partial [Escherichia coli]|nr:sulfatase-like hydrolase/transferase [Escherichia coli]
MLRQLMRVLCHPATAAVATVAVMAGLYSLEKTPSVMPFLAAVIATIGFLIFLLSRRAYVSLYSSLAIVTIIGLASTVKYKLKGFDLHVFDFKFTGGDPQALWFLLKGYWFFIVPVLALIIVSIVAISLLAFYDKPARAKLPARMAALALMPVALYASYPLPAEEPRYFYYLGGFDASAFFVSLVDLQYAFKQGEFETRMRATPPQAPYPDTLNCGDVSKLPDIVLVLSESQTDFKKNLPGLDTKNFFDGDFVSQDGKKHPLYVETFGGGTWVTSIALMTGISSPDFGVQAPYLTTVLDGKVRGALPEVLARCGYRTVEITPVSHTFVNEGPFMQSIGYQEVLDYDKIGATQYAHRDNFYFATAEKVLREHHKTHDG